LDKDNTKLVRDKIKLDKDNTKLDNAMDKDKINWTRTIQKLDKAHSLV
jgi:hypothetical protein